MFKSLSIVFVAFLVQGVLSQAVLDGQCPEVKPLKYFNFKAFMGRYYGFSHFPADSAILNNTRCIYGDYSLTGKNTGVLKAAGINIDTEVVERETIDIVNFGGGAWAFGFGGQSVDQVNTNILATDYKHFSIVYSCQNTSETQYTVVAWLISRKQTLAKRYVEKAKRVFKSVNLDYSKFVAYDQKKCPTQL